MSVMSENCLIKKGPRFKYHSDAPDYVTASAEIFALPRDKKQTQQ